jgi:cobalt-zinc-cadmium efflux system membrane fusion protein
MLRTLILLLSLLTATWAMAANDHEHSGKHGEDAHHHDHEVHDHDHQDHATEGVTIAPAIAEQNGITVAVAGPGTLKRALTLYGRTATAPDRLSHIYARFPGVIKKVHVTVGDTVKAGAVLAEVESNESLKPYSLIAPIDGVIIQRHANAGEATRDQRLFAIAGFDPLVAELQVFPGQRSDIRGGQPLLIRSGNLKQISRVLHLVPEEDSTAGVIARAQIANPENQWSPGLLITAEVEIESLEAQVRIDNRALQIHEGKPVVFVQEWDHYTPRQVQIGRRDHSHAEVLSGLEAGEHYVVEQSYLIKADLEKAGLEHHHH